MSKRFSNQKDGKWIGPNLSDLPHIESYLEYDGVVMMDSGAYQVLLYGDIELGVTETLDLQMAVGADFGVIMDHPIGYKTSHSEAQSRIETTLKNLKTSIDYFGESKVNWTLPIQGGRYLDLMGHYLNKVIVPEVLSHFSMFALGSVVPVMINQDYSTLVKMIATAGIREADGLIEEIGIERSFTSLRQAQVIVWMMDASGDVDTEYSTMLEHVGEKKNVIAVWNKSDLIETLSSLPGIAQKVPDLPVSALSVSTSRGIDAFMDAVENCVWHGKHCGESEMAVSSRHAALLDNTLQHLPGADENIKQEEWELAAVRIRSAVFALGTITGEDADPDVLDDIFSRFCIGK